MTLIRLKSFIRTVIGKQIRPVPETVQKGPSICFLSLLLIKLNHKALQMCFLVNLYKTLIIRKISWKLF